MSEGEELDYINRIAKWMYNATDDGNQVPWDRPDNARILAQTRRQVRAVLSAIAANPEKRDAVHVTKLCTACRKAALEDAAQIAERDVDWTNFGKQNIEQWDGGPDEIRDYRLGINTGRVIASTIRALAGGKPE